MVMQELVNNQIVNETTGVVRPPSQLEFSVLSILHDLKALGVKSSALSVISPRETVHMGDMKERIGLGEISMPFISALILKLEEFGKFKIDDGIIKHLPNLNKYIPQVDKISIRNLLNHSSGLPNYYDSELELFSKGLIKEKYTENDMLELISDIELTQEPYKTTDYGKDFSHTNYLLLGRLIEAKTNLMLPQAVCMYLFKLIGLHNTRWGDAEHTHLGLKNGFADSAITSNAIDLANFFKALFDDKTVIKRSCIEKYLNEGLGLFQATIDDKIYYYFYGDIAGCYTSCVIYTQKVNNKGGVIITATIDYTTTSAKDIKSELEASIFRNLDYIFR